MHPNTPNRRTHAPEFKAQVLAPCRQPGASIAALALAHGLNSNVVHNWLAGIGMKRSWQRLPTEANSPAAPMQFLPVGLTASNAERGAHTQDIRLDLDLGALQIKRRAAGLRDRLVAVSGSTSGNTVTNPETTGNLGEVWRVTGGRDDVTIVTSVVAALLEEMLGALLWSAALHDDAKAEEMVQSLLPGAP